MIFVISVFGDRFLGMLSTCLHSIEVNAPSAEVMVFWQETEEYLSDLIQATYSQYKFVKTDFPISGSKTVRISSKTVFWEYAAKMVADSGFKKACFMDVDTIVLKDIQTLFDTTFDIAFSIKEEKWPLNTGVLLVNFTNPATVEFFTRWKHETIRILRDPITFEEANSSQFPYGGADQMSLHRLIGFSTSQFEYMRNNIRFKGFRSEIFNETRSTPLSSILHIIHYKGGWQRVLIDGKTFPKKAPAV